MDGSLPGPLNMARDEYLLQCALKHQRAFLRLYSWDITTLSLGRSQNPTRDINLKACSENNIPLVRRITGGRTVIHGQDLTYTIAAPRNIFSQSDQTGLMDIYRHISQIFFHFFRSVGINIQIQPYTPKQRARLSSSICFATPSAFELLYQGKKLLGSAQRMLPHTFLQHGSLPLYPQHELIKLLFLSPERKLIHNKMTDLSSISSSNLAKSTSQLQKLLLKSFEKVLGIRFSLSQWQTHDHQAIQQLLPNYPLLNSTNLLPVNSVGTSHTTHSP